MTVIIYIYLLDEPLLDLLILREGRGVEGEREKGGANSS
jgi:hypothetical protein